MQSFVDTTLFVSLWLLQIQSAVGFSQQTNDTVYIRSETKTAELSCGQVPKDVIAIEWDLRIYESEKILKFYTSLNSPRYSNNFSSDKYDIGESVNNSLLIKNIEHSDTGYYICRSVGGADDYEHTTKLQVVGK